MTLGLLINYKSSISVTSSISKYNKIIGGRNFDSNFTGSEKNKITSGQSNLAKTVLNDAAQWSSLKSASPCGVIRCIRDRQTDGQTRHIGNNTLHFVHLMQPKNQKNMRKQRERTWEKAESSKKPFCHNIMFASATDNKKLNTTRNYFVRRSIAT